MGANVSITDRETFDAYAYAYVTKKDYRRTLAAAQVSVINGPLSNDTYEHLGRLKQPKECDVMPDAEAKSSAKKQGCIDMGTELLWCRAKCEGAAR